jgi:hypothetical protein
MAGFEKVESGILGGDAAEGIPASLGSAGLGSGRLGWEEAGEHENCKESEHVLLYRIVRAG